MRAWDLHLWDRQPEVKISPAIEQRTEFDLDRRALQADHGTADHSRPKADLVDRAHHPDRIGRIGTDDDEIRICRRNRPDGRREVGSCRWISPIIDDGEANRLGIFTRAFTSIQTVTRVGRHNRDRLRLWVLLHRQFEEAFGVGWLWVGPGRNHAEVVQIIKFTIQRGREQADEHLLSWRSALPPPPWLYRSRQ